MRYANRAIRIFVPILAVLLLAGCWDRREINDIAFVLGSAFDKKGDQYMASIQVALPSQMGGAGSAGGGGGTSGTKSWMLLSHAGDTVRMANYEEQLSMSRQIFFAHRRVLLVGEELARAGIGPVMDLLGRVPQNRLSAYMVATDGDALPYMKVTGEIERYPSEIVRELAVNAMKNPSTIKSVIDRLLSEGVDVVLPAIRIVKTEQESNGRGATGIKMDGLAIFRGGKLIRYLLGEDAQFMLLAMGEANEVELQIDAPKGRGAIVVRLMNTGMSVKPTLRGDELEARIMLMGKAVVVENESNYSLSSDDHLAELEDRLNRKLAEGVRRVVSSVQQEGADPVGIGRVLSKKMPAVWERHRWKWGTSLKAVRIDVESKLRIGNTGTVLKGFGMLEEELVE